MSRNLGRLASLLLVVLGANASAKELMIGDPAPKIEVQEFVKGEPVKEFTKGKTYVVEFWATWCGPCRTSIPHLTELAKKNKDATFLGVSVFEQDYSGVKPFVKEMGDKMDYVVATDFVPEGKGRQDGAMGKSWMEAAGEQGIPTAFIVNGEGKIAWIGHPMELEKPLEKVLAGDWNIAAAREERVKQKELAEKRDKAMQAIGLALQKKDDRELLKAIDQAEADGVAMPPMVAVMKINVLSKSKDTKDKALKYAKGLIEGAYKDEGMMLNNVAWALVAPDAGKPDPDLVKLGLDAAKRADDLLEKKDPAVADTLAKAYFESGEITKAIETQERAVKLAQGTELANDMGLKQRLEQYRKAAK